MRVIRFFGFLLCLNCFGMAYANECVSYKITPKITISNPSWTKEVVQPLEPMDLWHGNVIATMVDNYDIVADITSIEDGFCVGIICGRCRLFRFLHRMNKVALYIFLCRKSECSVVGGC